MTTRILPHDEWHRLGDTQAGSIWPQLDPKFSEVLVVEQSGEIVGCVVLMMVLHAECATNLGGVGVAKALHRAMRDRLRLTKAAGAVWAAAVDEPMRSLLDKHAERVPGEHFILKVNEPCLQS